MYIFHFLCIIFFRYIFNIIFSRNFHFCRSHCYYNWFNYFVANDKFES